MPFNSVAKGYDWMFGVDGRWLYFLSKRTGGLGNEDLYRTAVGDDDGDYRAAEHLGPEVTSPGSERASTPSRDGRHLLFASNRPDGAGCQGRANRAPRRPGLG